MPNRISAEFCTVMLCLEALQCICYHVFDYSSFKVHAWRAGNKDVAQVTEMMVSYNQRDVEKSSMIFESCLFVVIIV